MVRVHVEPWPASMSGPYLLLDEDIESGHSPVAEDGGDLRSHLSPEVVDDRVQIAFVDGVRRAEARLYLDDGERMLHGIAGAHGHGAVLCEGAERPVFEDCHVERIIVWGGGAREALPEQPGNWSWSIRSIPDEQPDAPLQGLQRFMREAEGELAEQLATDGWLTIVDGPLNFVRSRERPVIGYVKTHHRAYLAPEQHARVPQLGVRERTSLFTKRDDVYSCYVRLAEPPSYAGPWSGIARLEIPSSVGLAEAAATADDATAHLCRYAGVPHKDPRAPQNLQPVSRLESYLRRLLGDDRLAVRAARAAALATGS